MVSVCLSPKYFFHKTIMLKEHEEGISHEPQEQMTRSALELQAHSSSNIKKGSASATLQALFKKSMTLQSRNCCSNACQAVSPILCLLFTLAVRQIVAGITTGAVWSIDYPQPLNMPIVDSVIRPQLGLNCQQLYYFDTSPSAQAGQKLLGMQMKEVCPDGSLSPKMVKVDSANAQIMACLQRADKLNFERGDDLKTDMPDGIIRFKQADSNNLSAALAINDFRLPQYHKNNGVTKIVIKTSETTTISTYLRVTEGLISLVERVTRPFLMLSNPKEVISGSIMYMPFSGEDKTFVSKMVNVIGSGLYPLGISLLLPLLLYMLVSQKEERQLEIMKMNGLEMRCYWVNFFIVSFGMSIACSTIMYVAGTYIILIDFFIHTSPLLLWAVFIGWAIAQVAMAALFQIFINSAKTATIVGYVLSIFSTLIGVPICTVIFPAPMTLPLPLALYPPLALSRIIYHLGMACADSVQCFRSVKDANSEFLLCLAVLYCWIFVFLLSMTLNDMVQQQYGVAKRPQILQKVLIMLRKPRQNALLAEEAEGGNDLNGVELAEMGDKELVDVSVTRHASDLARQDQNQPLPLLIRGLSKHYETDNGEKGRIALRPLTLGLKKGQIFGFLGPNGAGKTTLISVLTAMHPQTSGTAWISGQPIGTPSTNKLIGVCPQFDILWKQLTIQEHLLFYSRMKGVPPQQIHQRVRESLEEVDLYQRREMKAGELSGGMQRRLSIAIALVGKPSVIFLDQPSSGLDPFHRRQIWDILLRCKNKTAIFLTSHMMDEVEHLCDRIGIISQGQLRCIGEIRELKERFGKGYKLVVSYPHLLRQGGERPPILRKLQEQDNLEVISQLETRVILRINKSDIPRCLSLLKEEREVVWSIEQPSLYDVFTHFVT